jgi:hypothetical protein
MTLVFGCSLIAVAKEPDPELRVAFPQAGVELLQPAGFERAKDFEGFAQPEKAASVLIMVIPAPSTDVTSGMTAEAFKTQGIALLDKTPVTVAGQPGLLLHATQSHQDIDFEKWVVVFGDRSTTMITATYPQELTEEFSEPLQATLLSARLINVNPGPPGSSVDFQIAKTDKLKLASDANKMLAYTRSGSLRQKSLSDPLFVAAKSVSPTSIENRDTFSKQRLSQTATVRIDRIESHKQLTIDGLDARETVARATHKDSNTPRSIYQVIIFLPNDSYYLLQGMVGADGSDEFIPVFRTMAESFTRRDMPPKSSGQPKP